MCNKMFKNYTRFCNDMADQDIILRITSTLISTCVYKETNNDKGEVVPTGITGITPGQLVPSTHKVQIMIGGRRSDHLLTIVKLTAEEYNDTIRKRMTSNATTETRAMAWRNYLIDNGLLPKLVEVYEKAVNIGVIPTYTANYTSIDALKKEVARFVKPTHERIAA